nr:MAG TPA: hypothetical protein [Bacteriophage sp.]
MGILAFFGFISVFIVIVTCTYEIRHEGNTALSIVLLVNAVIGLLFIIAHISNTPTALDVYEGKTELKTTYEGKVPVDSVVIYKK